MIEDFHKTASEHFSSKGRDLAASLSTVTATEVNTFKGPELYSVAEWNENDILNFGPASRLDSDGQEIARYGNIEGEVVGFENETYLDFITLVKSIQKTNPLKNVVSFETIRDLCFTWMLKYRDSNNNCSSLPDFIIRLSRKLVRTHKIAIPIFEPSLESLKCIGKVELCPISSQDIDKWSAYLVSRHPDMKENLHDIENQWTKRYQGRALAFIEVEAEQCLAQEIASQEVEKVVAALRLFSPGTLKPQACSNCVPLGHEHLKRNLHLFFKGDQYIGESESISLESGSPLWKLTDEDFDLFWESGLRNLHELINETSPTPFEKDLINAMMIYSRVAISSALTDKLIYLFVTLESLLLENSNEPIQSTLSERAAFIIGKTVDERLDIECSFKDAYALRSKFFHHGVLIEIDQHATVKTFMRHVFATFFEILRHRSKFKTRKDLFDRLKRRKFQ